MNAALTADRLIGFIVDDDDPPALTISADRTRVLEGDEEEGPTITLTLSLDAVSEREYLYDMANGEVSVEGATSARGGTDFPGKRLDVIMKPGETEKNVTFMVRGDTVEEAGPDEVFGITIPSVSQSAVGQEGINHVTHIYIVDDDLAPVTGFTAGRDTGKAPLSWDAPGSGSDIDGHEYRYAEGAPSGTWTAIASSGAGEANAGSHEITGLTDDTTYTVELRSYENRTHSDTSIGTNGAYRADSPAARTMVTPGDDAIGIENASGSEGTGVTFTATLSKVIGTDATVTWTASIESGDTATLADLGTPRSGNVTIPAGQTTRTFTVPVVDDSSPESNERFTVTLTNAVGSYLDPSKSVAKGTIEDDEATLASLSILENGTSISLSPALTPAQTSYSGTPGTGTRMVTVEAVPGETGASWAVVDSSGNAVEDVSTESGHQVWTPVGPTTVRVKVTNAAR